MRFFGLLILFLAAGAAVYDKTSEKRRKRAEYTETLELLVYIKDTLASERRALSKILTGFMSSRETTSVGWLKDLFENGRLNEIRAGELFRERAILGSDSALDHEDKVKIADYFERFGKCDAGEEIRRTERIISHVSAVEKEKKASLEKEIKVAWLLFATVFVGIFILII